MQSIQSNSRLKTSFFLVLESAFSRLGQDPFKPDIARNDHHMTKQNITASEIDM
jgi:hypothetical protein